jgi:glucose uptake protein GlcU
MWGIGNSSFFLANNALTQTITFPIVSSGPSAISALWGILLYKEIKGARQLVILSIGFAFAVVGSILCALSKD